MTLTENDEWSSHLQPVSFWLEYLAPEKIHSVGDIYRHNGMCTYLVDSNSVSFLSDFSRTSKRLDDSDAFKIHRHRLIHSQMLQTYLARRCVHSYLLERWRRSFVFRRSERVSKIRCSFGFFWLPMFRSNQDIRLPRCWGHWSGVRGVLENAIRYSPCRSLLSNSHTLRWLDELSTTLRFCFGIVSYTFNEMWM